MKKRKLRKMTEEEIAFYEAKKANPPAFLNDNTVLFYHDWQEYGCFSNFSEHSFELEGKHWKTSEHYYQAKKFLGTKYEEIVRNAETAGETKRIAWSEEALKNKRKDWGDEVKDKVMETVLRAKFTQNEDILKVLLETGDKLLVENSKKDYYWGCGKDGSGKNRLGNLQMELREKLRKESKEEND